MENLKLSTKGFSWIVELNLERSVGEFVEMGRGYKRVARCEIPPELRPPSAYPEMYKHLQAVSRTIIAHYEAQHRARLYKIRFLEHIDLSDAEYSAGYGAPHIHRTRGRGKVVEVAAVESSSKKSVRPSVRGR